MVNLSAIILVAGIALALIVGRYRSTRGLAQAVVTLALLALLVPDITGPLSHDPLALFFTTLVLLVGFVTLLASGTRAPSADQSILLSVLGMVCAAGAQDLLFIYLAIELTSLPTIALVARDATVLRIEGAMKYFVVSIAASALLLLGVVLLGASAGTTALAQLRIMGSGFGILSAALFLTGLGFKLGVWPLNYWIPDVYQAAPPEIAGLLAGASKKAAFVALIRVLPLLALPGIVFAVLAALSMTIPNLAALRQDDTRRLLALSIMTHAGFLLMGFAVTGGIYGTLVHAMTHGFMAVGAFLALGVFAAHGLTTIDQLQGAGYRNPFLAGALTLFLLGLAGIPLLSGFVSKLVLFLVVAGGMPWLAALAILNSAIALYYYFRIIRALYGHPGSGRSLRVRAGLFTAIMLCLLVTVAVGLYPAPLLHWAALAVP